jgi:Polysaccharide pyruvyl transferase
MSGKALLAQFGTFDVENYGDLLYPIIFERMLRERSPATAIGRFSFMGSESLQDTRYSTEPIQSLLSSQQKQTHTLLIGGGDLLRTDWDVMASHYHSARIPAKDQDLRLAMRQLFIHWFQKRKPDTNGFRTRFMNYAAAGPFIINPDDYAVLKSVVYCSCGVPFQFGDTVRQGVADAFNKAGFIYVRDRQSRDTLVRAGVTREIHVAPDLIVALSDFFDPVAERQKGRRLLHAGGVDIARKILCVQSNPQPIEKSAELLKQLLAYQKRTGCEVILVPLGPCHGDNQYLSQLAKESGNKLKYIQFDSIFDIITVLAACDIFLGTSLHGNITAFSFGIPHLIGPIDVAKCEGFLDIVGLPLDLKLKSWSEINHKLDIATNLEREFFATRASTAKTLVNKAFNLLLQAISNQSIARPQLQGTIVCE